MNTWIAFVKAYCTKNNCKYNDALKDPKVKAAYLKSKKQILIYQSEYNNNLCIH